MNDIVEELKKLRECMRRVVGLEDENGLVALDNADIDLVTRAIEHIEWYKKEHSYTPLANK